MRSTHEAFSRATGRPVRRVLRITLSERVVSNLELVTEAGSTVADFMRGHGAGGRARGRPVVCVEGVPSS